MEYIRTNIIGILVVVVGLLVVTNAYTLWRVNTGFNSAKEWHEYELTYFAKAEHEHEHDHQADNRRLYDSITDRIREGENDLRDSIPDRTLDWFWGD